MELKDVYVGQLVRVVDTVPAKGCNYDTFSVYGERRGTVIKAPDEDGDVIVEFSDGRADIGHHSNLKRIKEKHS